MYICTKYRGWGLFYDGMKRKSDKWLIFSPKFGPPGLYGSLGNPWESFGSK